MPPHVCIYLIPNYEGEFTIEKKIFKDVVPPTYVLQIFFFFFQHLVKSYAHLKFSVQIYLCPPIVTCIRISSEHFQVALTFDLWLKTKNPSRCLMLTLGDTTEIGELPLEPPHPTLYATAYWTVISFSFAPYSYLSIPFFYFLFAWNIVKVFNR